MITGPTPDAAIRVLRDSLQQAASCVTTAVVVNRRDPFESELYLATRLATDRGERLTLSARHFYEVSPSGSHERRDHWRAQTTAYYYTLDAADGREILAYHWHPTGNSHVTTPHLHLGAGAGALRPELTKAHLDTGFVTPVTLIALAIERFGVRPRRADWAAVIDRARRQLQLAYG